MTSSVVWFCVASFFFSLVYGVGIGILSISRRLGSLSAFILGLRMGMLELPW